MSRNIRRLKQKKNVAPVAPKYLRELIFDERYTVTTNDENFMMYDSGPTDRRTVIFATDANISFLQECEEWYLDGTFRISPPLFSQVYTIHGKQIFTYFVCPFHWQELFIFFIHFFNVRPSIRTICSFGLCVGITQRCFDIYNDYGAAESEESIVKSETCYDRF